MRRALRKATVSTRSFGPLSSLSNSSGVSATLRAPSKPGFSSDSSLGRSSSVPSVPAKAERNSPRAGSSGMTKSRGGADRTPTASRSGGITSAPTGWEALIWS